MTSAPPGLSRAEARARLRRFGRNEFRPETRRSWARELLRRFTSPLVAMLLLASAVSAFLGDTANFAIILTMVALSVAIDFVQEHRAGKAAQALLRRVQVHATVLRDGAPVSVPVDRVVPGDVALLAAGSVVPGDGRVLESNALHVNEALLTGEPFPVEKRPAAGERGAAPLSMGTSVVSGTGTMEVTATGRATAIGQLAATLAAAPPPGSLERGTRAFGMMIMRITAFLALFVILVNLALHRPLLDSFLFAVALAVGLTPELLPMIVTVTLTRGAMRLAERHVIVKRLAAVEGLGSMDVLCTDKTGTLTAARIRVERHVDWEGRESARCLELAYANSRFQAGVPNPLDAAILAHAQLDVARFAKVAEAPFDFERRRVSVLLREGRQGLLVVKGAAESVLALCAAHESAGSREALAWTPASRARAGEQLQALGERGLRVLAVARKDLSHERITARDEHGLVFVGFLAFIDPPKPGAARALAALEASGVHVKILTGDDPRVARHLCESMGVAVGGVLTGEEIDRLDDPALAARVGATTLFCRATPAQKNRIVLMLKARGHVVGYLGDGINDAPALRSADVGLSVSNAVDVAREAADLILLRRDLDVLHHGVLEGRRTFVNIRKYLLMGTSSSFGNMFSMAAASLFLPFLPLLPTQILVNNLLYDVSEIPIPLDTAEDAEIARPQRWDLRLIRDFMWTLGPVSSLFDFLTFYLLFSIFAADEALFRTGWFVESLATQVLVIFVIRARGSAFGSRPAAALVATSIAVVAVAVALPYTPLAPVLGFAPLPPRFLALLAGLVAAYLVLAELAKRAFYRRRERVAARAFDAHQGRLSAGR